MKRIILFLLFIILISASYAQDSLNCRLVSTTGTLASVNGFALKDSYAFTGQESFSIMDLSDIHNPVLIFNDTIAKEINSIVIVNNYAYLAVREGLIILDISSYESPELLSFFKTDEYIEEVEISNNIAYLGTMAHSFLVIDVSDPHNPYEITRVDQILDNVWNIEIKDTLLFAASTDAGVKIFNISNPSKPQELGTMDLFSASDVKVNGNIAYAAQKNILYSFDISDLSNPQMLDYLLDGGGYNIAIEGNYAYCLGSGVRIVDISDPSNLTIAGYYLTPKNGFDIYVRDGLIYAACQEYGIYFIQFDAPTSIEENISKPEDFILSQNYPNPFNPSTKINYTIKEPGNVQIKVFDVLGKELKTIVNTFLQPGSYHVDFSSYDLSSGVYYYRIITNDYAETKKMVLTK